MKPLYRLAEIASILRSEGGCAWDRKQTYSSLKPYLIEEAYEVYDAIESENMDDLKEELGDLLYQIYAHAQLASEEGRFTIDDVAEGISEKLVFRHPHVFGEEEVNDAEEVIARWEILKKKEKKDRKSILEGVPRHLPALLKAYRIQQKVGRVGFEWDKIEDVVLKIEEELEEFKEAVKLGDREEMVNEAGDILFSMVNLLRFAKINAEEALTRTNKKFTERFMKIEERLKKEHKNIEEMTLKELDALWESSKQ